MVKKEVDYYEVSVKMLIQKRYWDAEHGDCNNESVADRIQQGVEVPIDSMEIGVKK